MAVAKFATNNLVKEHDEYVKFMENREKELKKDGKSTDVLFYKKRLLNDAPTNQNNSLYRAINKWHCIMLSNEIWCKLIRTYVHFTPNASYKQIVDVSSNVLSKFKWMTEHAIEVARCDINTKVNKNSHWHGSFDACRYLAIYWTYLDIIKDTKTQRFIPNNATIKRAAEVFGYKSDENPFKMNGAYWNWNKEKEEQPMEEKTEVNDDILATPIRDLNLTIRSFNCLYRSKILTLGDICMKSQRQLLKIRNLGRNSLNEIKAKLAEYDYYYMDLDSNAQKAHSEEESAVDIAEQVVEEMQEKRPTVSVDDCGNLYVETLGIASPSKVISNKQDVEKPIVSVDEYDELYDKYNFLKTEYDKLDTKYDMLLKEKMDLEQYNSRLKDDINNLRDTNRGLEARLNGCNPYKMDTIDLVKLVISNMNKDKMDWLFLTLNGMTVDIHKKADVEGSPRMSYTIRTRED